MFLDLYEMLKIEPDADVAAIKHAYRSAAREHHPDQHKDKDPEMAQEQMALINEAARVLLDPDLRPLYDEYRDEMLFRLRLKAEGRELPSMGMNPEESSLSRIDQELKAFARIRGSIQKNRMRYGSAGTAEAGSPVGGRKSDLQDIKGGINADDGRVGTGFAVGPDGGTLRSPHREGFKVHSRPEKVYIKTEQEGLSTAVPGGASGTAPKSPRLKRKETSIWDKLDQTAAPAAGNFTSSVSDDQPSAQPRQAPFPTKPRERSGLVKFPDLPKPTGQEPAGDAERIFQKAVFDGLMKLYDASLNSILWTLHKDPDHAGALYFLGRYCKAGIHGLNPDKAESYIMLALSKEEGLAEKYASVLESLE